MIVYLDTSALVKLYVDEEGLVRGPGSHGGRGGGATPPLRRPQGWGSDVPDEPPPFDPTQLWLAGFVRVQWVVFDDAGDPRELLGEEGWARFVEAVGPAQEEKYRAMSREERRPAWERWRRLHGGRPDESGDG